MAAAQRAEGVILRKYYLRETSYILVVFTREFGKIKAVMKGIRQPYPQFAGNFEVFTRCQMLFYRKRKSSMDLATQCETLDFFYPVRGDIERLTYANYLIELIDMVTVDHDPNEEIYRLLVKSLDFLAGGASPKRVTRIFEIKLLGALGIGPQLDECVLCGGRSSEGMRFSVANGGVLCAGCLNADRSALSVSLGTLNFMRKIQKSDLSRTPMIKVSSQVGKETEKVLRDFLAYHINRPVKSLGFLAQLEKAGIV